MERAVFRFCGLVIAATAVAGCGVYTTSGGVPSHVRTVGVAFFENATVETGLEGRLAQALTDNILGRSQFRYASSRVADAVIRGRIVKVQDEPLAYTGDQVSQYQVVVIVSVEVWDRTKRRTLWESDTVRGLGTYEASGGLDARDEAHSAAVTEVSQQVIDGLMSGW